ncbi:hypothetical protein F4815DRAFT_480427 [Daldinia loculata]|uniref:uncharacterized protein n=1 Tax=Daldinia loculata TaxID=103429 RepID=UPI0020C329AA|nr:uncharacterized protein F4817DRAFT_349918 [Daldinia loculata]KAI1643428.1 hypothetical protein F4817DRAFT_349918 [Daldinia loculata]KAI2777719.1 hypothetical protein F4815DRAFT_480427 [Daldinia loculata]
MALSGDIIVGIVSILIMCIIAGLQCLPRFIRRRNAQSLQETPINYDLLARSSALESGTFYAMRGVRVDTFALWSSRIPGPSWAFPDHGSEPHPSSASTFSDDTLPQRRLGRIFIPQPDRILGDDRST